MWWRRGLLSILLLIIFNHNDLRIFFRLGFFPGRCWRLDWCFKGLLLFLGCFLLWYKQGTRWVMASGGDTGGLVCMNHLQNFQNVVRIETKVS
jgi:hypothetical protein